jgi:hypothetical protein
LKEDEGLDEFGLSEDYDYEVDDNSDRFKTLNDKTLLYFIENYAPDKNNSELVNWDQCFAEKFGERNWHFFYSNKK